MKLMNLFIHAQILHNINATQGIQPQARVSQAQYLLRVQSTRLAEIHNLLISRLPATALALLSSISWRVVRPVYRNTQVGQKPIQFYRQDVHVHSAISTIREPPYWQADHSSCERGTEAKTTGRAHTKCYTCETFAGQ